MHGMMSGMMGYSMMTCLLWGVALLVGIFLACYLIFRLVRKQKETSDNAMDQLKIRFASGEISKEEYEERKKVLQG